MGKGLFYPHPSGIFNLYSFQPAVLNLSGAVLNHSGGRNKFLKMMGTLVIKEN